MAKQRRPVIVGPLRTPAAYDERDLTLQLERAQRQGKSAMKAYEENLNSQPAYNYVANMDATPEIKAKTLEIMLRGDVSNPYDAQRYALAQQSRSSIAATPPMQNLVADFVAKGFQRVYGSAVQAGSFAGSAQDFYGTHIDTLTDEQAARRRNAANEPAPDLLMKMQNAQAGWNGNERYSFGDKYPEVFADHQTIGGLASWLGQTVLSGLSSGAQSLEMITGKAAADIGSNFFSGVFSKMPFYDSRKGEFANFAAWGAKAGNVKDTRKEEGLGTTAYGLGPTRGSYAFENSVNELTLPKVGPNSLMTAQEQWLQRHTSGDIVAGSVIASVYPDMLGDFKSGSLTVPSLDPNGPAAKAGVRRGDVLFGVRDMTDSQQASIAQLMQGGATMPIIYGRPNRSGGYEVMQNLIIGSEGVSREPGANEFQTPEASWTENAAEKLGVRDGKFFTDPDVPTGLFGAIQATRRSKRYAPLFNENGSPNLLGLTRTALTPNIVAVNRSDVPAFEKYQARLEAEGIDPREVPGFSLIKDAINQGVGSVTGTSLAGSMNESAIQDFEVTAMEAVKVANAPLKSGLYSNLNEFSYMPVAQDRQDFEAITIEQQASDFVNAGPQGNGAWGKKPKGIGVGNPAPGPEIDRPGFLTDGNRTEVSIGEVVNRKDPVAQLVSGTKKSLVAAMSEEQKAVSAAEYKSTRFWDTLAQGGTPDGKSPQFRVNGEWGSHQYALDDQALPEMPAAEGSLQNFGHNNRVNYQNWFNEKSAKYNWMKSARVDVNSARFNEDQSARGITGASGTYIASQNKVLMPDPKGDPNKRTMAHEFGHSFDNLLNTDDPEVRGQIYALANELSNAPLKDGSTLRGIYTANSKYDVEQINNEIIADMGADIIDPRASTSRMGPEREAMWIKARTSKAYNTLRKQLEGLMKTKKFNNDRARNNIPEAQSDIPSDFQDVFLDRDGNPIPLSSTRPSGVGTPPAGSTPIGGAPGAPISRETTPQSNPSVVGDHVSATDPRRVQMNVERDAFKRPIKDILDTDENFASWKSGPGKENLARDVFSDHVGLMAEMQYARSSIGQNDYRTRVDTLSQGNAWVPDAQADTIAKMIAAPRSVSLYPPSSAANITGRASVTESQGRSVNRYQWKAQNREAYLTGRVSSTIVTGPSGNSHRVGENFVGGTFKGDLTDAANSINANALGEFGGSRHMENGELLSANADGTNDVYADKNMVARGVNLGQQSMQGAFDGVMPKDPMSALTTVKNRMADNIYKSLNKMADDMKEGGASETTIAEHKAKIKEIADKVGKVILKTVTDSWDPEMKSMINDGSYNSAKLKTAAGWQEAFDKNPTMQARAGATAEQLANSTQKVTVFGDDDVAYTGGGGRGGWGGGSGGGRQQGGNIFGSAGGVGSAMYGAYMLSREWKMAMGTTEQDAKAYRSFVSSVSGMSIQDGTPATQSMAGANARSELTQLYNGQAASEVMGSMGGFEYMMTGYGPGVGRVATSAKLGVGVAGAGVIGAGTMGMMGMGAASPYVLAAGLAAGAGIAIGGAAMEAANVTGLSKAWFGEDIGIGTVGDLGNRAFVSGRIVAQNLDKTNGDPVTSFISLYAKGGLEKTRNTAYMTDEEKDVILGLGQTPEISALMDQAKGVTRASGVDVSSSVKTIQALKRFTGNNADLSPLSSLSAAGMTNATSFATTAVQDGYADPTQLVGEAAQFASKMGIRPGTSKFGNAMEDYRAGGLENRPTMDFQSDNISRYGSQLQASMGRGAEFYGMGAQLAQKYDIQSQWQTSNATSMLSTIEASTGQRLNASQIDSVVGSQANISTPVSNAVNQVVGSYAMAGGGSAGAASIASGLSGVGMSNQSASLLSQIAGGDMHAQSYNAWQNGDYQYRWFDQGGNSIQETNGLSFAKTMQAWGTSANMGNENAVKLMSTSGMDWYKGGSTTDIMRQLLGTTNPEILKAYGENGSRGIEALSRRDSAQAQLMSSGIQMKGIALSEKYNWGSGSWNAPSAGSSWGLEDKLRSLQYASQTTDFAVQSQRMDFSNQNSIAREQNQYQRMQVSQNYNASQLSTSYNQFQKQKGWAQEDYQYQDTMTSLTNSWNLEDINENIRLSSGRQRRQLLKQKDRMVTTQNLEGEQVETQRDRQKEVWANEEERFRKQKDYQTQLNKLDTQSYDLNKSQREKLYAMDKEDLSRKKKEFEENKKVQDEVIQLQRKYQYDQLQLQKESAGVSAWAAAKQVEYNDALIKGAQNSKAAVDPFIEMSKYDKVFSNLTLLQQMMKGIDGINPNKIASIISMLQQLSGAPALITFNPDN
jgi:hypothetical protein